MRTVNADRRRASRRAYTLMEMITVQAVLIALVALSWPALRGSLQKNELVDAARRLRTELIRTRQTAIETGIAQSFRYRPDSSTFEIQPAQPASNRAADKRSDRLARGPSNNVAANRSDAAAPMDKFDTATLDAEKSEHRLPGAVRFARACSAERSDRLVPDTSNTDTARELVDGEEWSAPITFFPNGRSSSARIRLEDKDRHIVEVALRGVTGTVAVGEIRRDADETRVDDGPSDARSTDVRANDARLQGAGTAPPAAAAQDRVLR